MKRTAILLSAAAVALAAGGCGSDSSSSGDAMKAETSTAPASTPAGGGPAVQNATVDIKAFKYKPVTVTVKKGGKVKWVNSDDASHTSTGDDRSFDTQTIDKGKAKTVSMTSAGTFPYHCDFHPFMKGTIVVR